VVHFAHPVVCTFSTKTRFTYKIDPLLRPINALSNLYLFAKDGEVAAYSGKRESADVGGKFFTTNYTGSGTLSFHPGDDTHHVGLSGTNGLLRLVDLERPSAATIPKDLPTEWSVFQIGPNGELLVKDGQNIPTRQFVIFLDTDGTYYVGLWDGRLQFASGEKKTLISYPGITPQRRTVSNITVIATKANAPK
jgi:hypothetical protein